MILIKYQEEQQVIIRWSLYINILLIQGQLMLLPEYQEERQVIIR